MMKFLQIFFKKTVEIYFIMRYTIKGSFYSRAEIAQLVEHFTRNEGVEGSSPFSSFYRRREFQEPVVVQVFETPFYLPGKKYSAL